MRHTQETFGYFDTNDPGQYMNWYILSRRRLIKRLLLVQREGLAVRNTKIFDSWLMSNKSIKDLHREYSLSKKQVRQLLNKQLKILHILWEKEGDD